jgi:predicted ATP-grasp superfamily ATP-dependent carboligase/phosphoglycolate phosphatase-like HAD superfamily hydrolase
MKRRVLIVTGNYTKSYPVIESLKRAGYKIIVGVDDRSNPIFTEGFSLFSDKIEYVSSPTLSEKAYIQSIIQILKKHSIDIIIPVGFIDFLTISKYKKIIEKYCVVPTENYGKICLVSNKWYARKLAKMVNVSYPQSILLKSDETKPIFDFIEKSGLPIVVKGLGDNSKPNFIADIDRLLKVLNVRIKKEKILLQEYIPGTGVGYFVLSVRGKPLAEFAHQRIFEATPLGGASVKAQTFLDSEIFDLGRSIIHKLEWTGLMMVELKKENETGNFYLMELNPKFWGSLELAYRAGVDFPRYLVDFYLFKKMPEKISVKNVKFSWVESAIASYSKYGLKATIEALLKTLQKNLLMTDLHIHDIPNFSIKVLTSTYHILQSTRNKTSLANIYLTDYMKKALNECQLIIADLDGTLVRLNVPWHKVLERAISLGLVKKHESLTEAFYKYRLKNDMENFEKLNKIVEEAEIESAERITENKDLSKIIRSLRETGIQIAVISKQSKRSIEKILNNIGLASYIQIIIGREDAPLRTEQIHKVVKRVFGSTFPKQTETITLGDTLSDVKAAFKANTTPCRVVSTNIEKIQSIELGVSYVQSALTMLKILKRVYNRYQ